MNVKEFAEIAGLEVFTTGLDLTGNIAGGYVSDLLSDVMGNASEGEVWMTLQSHLNVIAIASLKELSAVVLVNGVVPDKKVIEKAMENKIPLLGSKEPTFHVAGKLYRALDL